MGGDGSRLLLTPMSQEVFNVTDDRKSEEPSLGVTCFDCHVNGHTTGQIELTPTSASAAADQARPAARVSFSKFTAPSEHSTQCVTSREFQRPRAAYFNGDQIHAAKKGQVFITAHPGGAPPWDICPGPRSTGPPAPKLNTVGRLDPSKATDSGGTRRGPVHRQGTMRRPGKGDFLSRQRDARPAACERFVNEHPVRRDHQDVHPARHQGQPDPYGRCFALEDTVEFFNLVLELKLNAQEKQDLVAFMRGK